MKETPEEEAGEILDPPDKDEPTMPDSEFGPEPWPNPEAVGGEYGSPTQ